MTRCPCGLPAPYEDCCGRFHTGRAAAPTAELLMRSRYSAFARHDLAYLARTWHPDTRPRAIHDDPKRRWTGLEVVATDGGGLLDPTGTVEFLAHHADGDGDGPGVVHEISQFVRLDGAWTYVDGVR